MILEEKIDFLKMAEEIKEELVYIRRDIHENPELGFEEYRTSKKIKDILDKEGIPYKSVAGTGIYALIKGEKAGADKVKTIALRGDIDALPIKDAKVCSYTSKVEGKMHACGHDAHTTILLGATKILNSIKKELKGNIVLLFEPAEETVGGAKYMIKEGVLEDPYVDAIIGLHVSEAIEAGKIGIKRDVFNAASNPFTIKVKGKGGHGAHPEDTIDPILIASNIIMSLQSIVSRELSPVYPSVITIGSIHGGTAENIIPKEVEIKGIIRTMTNEQREYAKKRVTEISKGIAESLRGRVEIKIDESYPCLYNDDEMVKLLEDTAPRVIGEENIIKLKHPSMGVESFAYFAMERPSVFYFLGSANFEKGISNPAHGDLFDIDENCLPIGVALQCNMAYEYLTRE
ncbi:amidohydrolase [Clostridium algidicarnis]|uniref:Amidohydrolase n=2 Tax=Clostridium algidicarnis TaxID=37659 RepID=A0ABS6C115_9CLOT|nr:amidohydrolase [Clostridium algidicarnis]MBU3202647.1 amidohydrolase [Clostridium algidicarnis]MBU3210801.1 amidohydrolase [Clostridium algidicarnis]MBU3219183.1 amidohydrolase [Clostridium algidicarnis]MBU3222691.1 amidohydrolase [Clostridium algidicarnis]